MTDARPAADDEGVATAGGRLVEGTTEPVDAATVLLLREGTDGMEVFLLERHVQSDFAGGAYAFPGGKVDAQDGVLPEDRWAGVDPHRVVDALGARSPEHAVGLLVAAVRETFEEAGPLLAHHADGRPVTAEDLASEPFREARRRLAARGEPWDWAPWLAEQDLVLDLGALVPFARWATPHGMHKRFDARFLAVALPPEQEAALGHDDVETTDSVWRRPEDALAAAERGEVVIIFPTRRTLQALAERGDVEGVVSAPGDPRRILPAIVMVDGAPHVRHPDGGPAVTI
jgi:8-oxo-dGTP pyrophosphatase MutT (NUDIX family)